MAEVKPTPLDPLNCWHVYPKGDRCPHVLVGNTCVCKPRVEPVDGRSLIVHNSFDGREAWEVNVPAKGKKGVN